MREREKEGEGRDTPPAAQQSTKWERGRDTQLLLPPPRGMRMGEREKERRAVAATINNQQNGGRRERKK
jgi:hypothetical protein